MTLTKEDRGENRSKIVLPGIVRCLTSDPFLQEINERRPLMSERVGDESPLIPGGVYEMSYRNHATWMFMGRQPKVVIYFVIAEPGDFLGLVVPAYYPVVGHTGARGKSGKFKASKCSCIEH